MFAAATVIGFSVPVGTLFDDHLRRNGNLLRQNASI